VSLKPCPWRLFAKVNVCKCFYILAPLSVVAVALLLLPEAYGPRIERAIDERMLQRNLTLNPVSPYELFGRAVDQCKQLLTESDFAWLKENPFRLQLYQNNPDARGCMLSLVYRHDDFDARQSARAWEIVQLMGIAALLGVLAPLGLLVCLLLIELTVMKLIPSFWKWLTT
jgi:hypothetical protein